MLKKHPIKVKGKFVPIQDMEACRVVELTSALGEEELSSSGFGSFTAHPSPSNKKRIVAIE